MRTAARRLPRALRPPSTPPADSRAFLAGLLGRLAGLPAKQAAHEAALAELRAENAAQVEALSDVQARLRALSCGPASPPRRRSCSAPAAN